VGAQSWPPLRSRLRLCYLQRGMKHPWGPLLLLLAGAFAAPTALGTPERGAAATDSPSHVRFEVKPEIALPDVPRIGVNLGRWRSYGAGQLCHNVLQNPGFEGTLDRIMVAVHRASAAGFTGREKALARPDDFWKGTRVEVRTGTSAGWQGIVARSLRAGRNGLAEFITQQPPPPLQPGDMIVLTRNSDEHPPGRWSIPASAAGRVAPVVGSTPPESPGFRSVALRGAPEHPAEVRYSLDTIDGRAGKLLPLEGKWRLAFWSKAEREPGELRVSFTRRGSPAPYHRLRNEADRADTDVRVFIDQRIRAAAEWQRTQIDFEAADNGPSGPLELRFVAEGPGGILLDDAELGPLDDSGGAFRAAVVRALRFLRPGYLRDWQGQEHDALENRLVDSFARRTVRSSGRPGEVEFYYSLPDFLELCHAAQALPWIVVPTEFSDRELAELGQFLKRRSGRDRFREIVVEFGRERGDVRRTPADVSNAGLDAVLADSAFELVRKGFGASSPLVTALSGPFSDAAGALAVAASTPHADALAVNSCFLRSLAARALASARLARLFPDDRSTFSELAAGLRTQTKDLAISEVDLHTTGGKASASGRDATTAGAAAAAALAQRILEAQAAGARRQCAPALTGDDTPTGDRSGVAPLWGLIRDLGPTQRFRPTGLAVAMLNRAIAGDLHQAALTPDTGDITFAAYRSSGGWSMTIVSARETPLAVDVIFPSTPTAPLPTRLLRLDAPSPWATNEDSEQVRIVEEPVRSDGSQISFRLPPLSLMVLIPQTAE